MSQIRCLIPSDFKNDMDEWIGVAESEGYETVTDMLWCMWIDDPSARLYTIANHLGWSKSSVVKLLKAMGIYELVDSYYRAMLWRHKVSAINAGYQSMSRWLTALQTRGYSHANICRLTGLSRKIYRKYYGGE